MKIHKAHAAGQAGNFIRKATFHGMEVFHDLFLIGMYGIWHWQCEVHPLAAGVDARCG